MPEVAVEEPRLSYFFPDDAIHAALHKERLQPGEKNLRKEVFKSALASAPFALIFN
jgi:hypothetical protein